MSASPVRSPRQSDSLSRASEAAPSPQAFAFQCAWIAALSFQYGYHIASLNGLLNVMSPDFNHMTVRPGHAQPGRRVAKADQIRAYSAISSACSHPSTRPEASWEVS